MIENKQEASVLLEDYKKHMEEFYKQNPPQTSGYMQVVPNQGCHCNCKCCGSCPTCHRPYRQDVYQQPYYQPYWYGPYCGPNIGQTGVLTTTTNTL